MNRSKLAPALLLFAVFGLSVWWLFGSSESPPSTPPPSAAPAPEAQAVRADPNLEDVAPAPAPELVPEAASAREAVAEASADAEPAQLEPALLLRVTHAATGQPAVGAEVFFWQRIENWLRWGALQLCAGGFDASAEKLGEPLVFETGPLGLASLPTAWPAGLIMVRLGGEVAFEFVDADLEGELELAIRPATNVVVRVVDPLGRPRPGAEVNVTAHFGERLQADENGRLELSYVTDLLAKFADEVTLDAGMRKPSVGTTFMGQSKAQAFPEDPRPKASFAAQTPPAEIELVTLAMGLVRVELIDAGGRPTMTGFPMLTFELDLEGIRWKGVYTEIPAGAVLDSWYPSGSAFEAKFQDFLAGTPAELLEGVIPGPGEPAIIWRIEVDGVPSVELTGRLVNGQTEPLAALDFNLDLVVEQVSMGQRRSCSTVIGQPLVTDSEGRFRYTLIPFMVSALQDADRWLVLRFVRRGRGTADTRSAKLELFEPGTPEAIELGDVALEQPPLVAAGRFVDGTGKPIGGVSYRIRLGASAIEGQAPVPSRTLDDGQSWLSDSTGRFEARRADVSGPIEICATAPGWIQTEGAACEAGSEGLEVRLAQAGTLVGSVELAAASPMIHARLEPSEGSRSGLPMPGFNHAGPTVGSWSLTSFVEAEGVFSFADLAPGFYNVSLFAGGAPPFGAGGKLFLEVTNVQVLPGQAAPEPRLEGLQLELESAE